MKHAVYSVFFVAIAFLVVIWLWLTAFGRSCSLLLLVGLVDVLVGRARFLDQITRSRCVVF